MFTREDADERAARNCRRKAAIIVFSVFVYTCCSPQSVETIHFNFTTVHHQAIAGTPNQNQSREINPHHNHRMNHLEEYKPIVISINDRNFTTTSAALNVSSSESMNSGASETILRPQVAVQIYTTTLNGTATDETPPQSAKRSRANHNSKSKQINFATSASNSNPDVQIDNPSNSVWQYETINESNKQQSAATIGEPVSALTDNGAPSTFTLAGPMINAVITVPNGGSGSSQQSSNYGKQHIMAGDSEDLLEDNYLQQPSGSNVANSTVNVERAISRFIDSQAANGNIEFSLSMNGDEMVINPVNKHAAKLLADSLTSTKLADEAAEANDEMSASSSARPPLGRRSATARLPTAPQHRHAMNLALRKHFKSELTSDDEQSASEIESLIDEKDDNYGQLAEDSSEQSIGNERDIGAHDTRPLSRRSSRAVHEKRSSSSGTNHDADSSRNKAMNGKLVRGKFKAASTSTPQATSFSDSVSDSEENDDQSSGGDSDDFHSLFNDAARLSKRRRGSTDSRREDEEDAEQRSADATRTKVKQRAKGRGKFYSFGALAAPAEERATSSTQRQVQRNDQQHSSGKNRANSNKQPTVVLRGEDAKRFEQLLENLKSLSIINLVSNADAKATRRLAASASLARTRNDHTSSSDDEGGRATGDGSDSQQDDSKEDNHVRGDAKRDRSSSTSLGTRLSNCEKNSKRKEGSSVIGDDDDDEDQKRSSSSNEESTTHEISLENDLGNGSDDMNDTDGSNNVEHHREMPTQQTSSSEQVSGAKQQLQPESGNNYPQAVFVRKTVLQSYYDRSVEPNASQQQFEASQEKSNPNVVQQQGGRRSGGESDGEERNGYRAAVRHSDFPLVQQSRVFATPASQQQIDHDNHQDTAKQQASPNSYIDYDKLDDREVYRASESQKVRTPLESNLDESNEHNPSHEDNQASSHKLRSVRQAMERVAQEARFTAALKGRSSLS